MAKALSETFLNLFIPTRTLSAKTLKAIALFQAVLVLFFWFLVPSKMLPSPGEVLNAFSRLWYQGFAQEIYSSFTLNLEALAVSTAISLALSYLLVIPFFSPIINIVSKLRFMGLVGWSLVFTLTFGGGHYLKVSLLVFGMSVFFVTAMASVVASIPKERFDHARTLRMGGWRILYEVVVLDTLADAWECMRQNAAIGWMMLTMVEGLSRSEGGIGILLLNQNRVFKLDGIFAIQLSILFLALFQDAVLGFLQKVLFPYHFMGKERK